MIVIYHILLFCSSAGSTCSSTSDHWLVRLAGASKRGSVVSRGPISGAPVPIHALESPELPLFRDEPPKAVETSKNLDVCLYCPDTACRKLLKC